MKCKNCGAELMEGIMFCPECGEKNETDGQNEYQPDQEEVKQSTEDTVPEVAEPVGLNKEPQPDPSQEINKEISKKYCPQCGTENAADAVFCGNCGFAFNGNASTATPEKKKSKSGLKKVLIAAAAVAGVAVLGFGAYTVLGAGGIIGNNNNQDTSKKLLYLKDNELNILLGKNPVAIDGDFGDGIYQGIDSSYYPVKFSEDGKYMFYPQDYTGSEYDLYRRKANSKKDQGIKLASGVRWYEVIDNNRIAYLKSDGKLYITKKDDKQRVDSDVRLFRISEDKKNIFWLNSNGDMFVRDINLKKDEKELDRDVDSTYYVSDDLKTIIYSADENLFVIKNFDDEEKIASDVTDVEFYVDDNDKLTLYYTKEDASEAELRIGDVIIDDMAASDAQIKEPYQEDYETTVMKNSYWGPVESTEFDSDAYYADYEKYEQKMNRDRVRMSLDETISLDYEEIYYYDVKENKSELVLAAPMIQYYNNSSEGIAVFGYYDTEEIATVNLSKLSDDQYYQVRDIVLERLKDTAKVCAIKKKEKIDLDIDVNEYDDFGYMRACAETDMIYLKYNGDDSNKNILLSTNFSKDKGKMTEITDELYDIEFVNEKGAYYIASLENGEGELFLNDDFLVDDVVSNTVRKFGKSGVLYATDKSDNEYTLMLYKNGKQKQIADEVADYYVQDDDRIAFLADYNFNKYKGDLKLYDNGKVKDIDTDVSAILRY